MGKNMENVRKYHGLNAEAISMLSSSLLSSDPVAARFNTEQSNTGQRTNRNVHSHVFMAHSDI